MSTPNLRFGADMATPQRFDPLGAFRIRPIAVGLGVGWVCWATYLSIFDRDVPGNAVMSVVTVAILIATSTLLTVATSPANAPVSRATFVVYVALLGAATMTSVAAQWGPDRNPLNDFMALVCAIGILVASPYRPWIDLVVAGALLATLCGVSAAVATSYFPVGVPAAVVGLIAAGPTVIATTSSAVFARTFVGLAARVQIRAASYSIERADREGITRTVQTDRTSILAHDVAPFFERLLAQRAITPADAEHARAIADGIRRLMVEEADRTWLHHAVTVAGGAASAVDDRAGLARTMDADERTIVRTTLRALIGAAAIDPAGIRVEVRALESQSSPRSEMRIRAHMAGQESDIRRMLNPYLGVLRMTFPTLRVAVNGSDLALRFAYDQR